MPRSDSAAEYTTGRAAQLPPPVVEEVRLPNGNTVRVVRDDLLLGGTKRRAMPCVLVGGAEFVYASPAYGYAQVALAHCCRDLGHKATVFTASRRVLHKRTSEFVALGGNLVSVEYGYLNVVQARAKEYVRRTEGAVLVPFGCDTPAIRQALARVASDLTTASLGGRPPDEVWCVAGSGTLTRSLQLAWPDAVHVAVQVGHDPDAGAALVLQAPEPFERDAIDPPPYPSCSNYDAKLWQFLREYAIRPNTLVWNVA